MAPLPDDPSPATGGGKPLPKEAVQELVAGLTWALPAGATVEAALRAAAEECQSWAAAAALTKLAERAERGEPFATLFSGDSSGLPPALVAALRGVGVGVGVGVSASVGAAGGSNVGAVGAVGGAVDSAAGGAGREDIRVAALATWAREQSMMNDLREEIRGALAYPATISFLAMLALLAIAMILAPSFQQLIKEFEMVPSMATRGLEALAVSGQWMLAALLMFPGLMLVVRLIGGESLWRTWCAQLPLVGPLWRWLAWAGWARWLALLIEAQVPLAESVRLAGAAAGDDRVRAASQRLATRVTLGGGMGAAMAETREWPATAAVIVGWGERSQTLAASLRAWAETCETRARTRARWTRLVAPPFAFLFVGATAGCAYWMMLAPMVKLISVLA